MPDDKAVFAHRLYQRQRFLFESYFDASLILNIFSTVNNFQNSLYSAARWRFAVFRIEVYRFVAECDLDLINRFGNHYGFKLRLK